MDGKKIRVSPDFGPNVTVKTDSWAVDIRPDHANNAYEAVYHCCGAYDSLSFGAVEGGPYKNGYFYYNGLPTQNIPTQGQANYAGHFIVSADHPAFDDEDYYRGDAAFNVDFGNKRLTGSLTHKAFQPISVSANISGNAFAGEATSSQIPAKAVVDGKFYGDNAKQLGGVFLGNEWGGAFGAAKK